MINEVYGTAWKQRDNDRDIKLGIQGNAIASEMHGHQCAQVRIQIQVQVRHLIVRVVPGQRRVPGLLGPCHGLCHGRQDQVQVSRSITIVRVTYYANDSFWDKHHLRSQVMFGVMESGFMTPCLVCVLVFQIMYLYMYILEQIA